MRKIYIVILIIMLKYIYPVTAIGNLAIDETVVNSSNPVIAIGNQAIDSKSQIAGNSPKSYTIFVDHMHGFHMVYEPNKNGGDVIVENYQNRTLHINIGDTIFWSNDAVPETELTIMSQPDLWKNIYCGKYLCSYLRWDYKKFGYTFNKSGIYKIYIQEFPYFNQTIIVGLLNLTLDNKTSMNMNIKSDETIKNKNQLKKNLTKTNNNSNPNSNYNVTIAGISIQLSSKFDSFILITVLLSMVLLIGRIKEDESDEVEIK